MSFFLCRISVYFCVFFQHPKSPITSIFLQYLHFLRNDRYCCDSTFPCRCLFDIPTFSSLSYHCWFFFPSSMNLSLFLFHLISVHFHIHFTSSSHLSSHLSSLLLYSSLPHIFSLIPFMIRMIKSVSILLSQLSFDSVILAVKN